MIGRIIWVILVARLGSRDLSGIIFLIFFTWGRTSTKRNIEWVIWRLMIFVISTELVFLFLIWIDKSGERALFFDLFTPILLLSCCYIAISFLRITLIFWWILWIDLHFIWQSLLNFTTLIFITIFNIWLLLSYYTTFIAFIQGIRGIILLSGGLLLIEETFDITDALSTSLEQFWGLLAKHACSYGLLNCSYSFSCSTLHDKTRCCWTFDQCRLLLIFDRFWNCSWLLLYHLTLLIKLGSLIYFWSRKVFSCSWVIRIDTFLRLEVKRDVVCKESFADVETLIHQLLCWLELSLHLGTNHVFFNDSSESLIIDILQ